MYKIKKIDFLCDEYGIENYVINKDGTLDVYDSVRLSFMGLKFLPLKFNVVRGFFDLSFNQLVSLKGSPVYVGRGYFCQFNNLTSLRFSPKEIEDDFLCNHNKLKNLNYSPERVGKNYIIFENELKSLKGIPRYIYGNFNCNYNKLKNLNYGPEYVYGYYSCSRNKLKNFKGNIICIKKELYVRNNTDIYSFEGLVYSIKYLYCENTILYNVWKLFQDVSKIELFNDMDIIRKDAKGKPIIILDRLNEFLDVIGKPRVKKVEGYINI